MDNVNLSQAYQSGQHQINLLDTLDRFRGVEILVIGDIMLDVDRVGDVTRISPEAPVPILLNPVTQHRLGGAGAVAAMCAALGAKVTLIGVIGEDRHGLIVRTLVGPAGVSLMAIIDPSRPTTTKERICGIASGRHRQQLSRLDHESTEPLSREIDDLLLQAVSQYLDNAGPRVILLSDYNKGTCSKGVVWELEDHDVLRRTIVDPPKTNWWHEKYSGIECVVPNRHESQGCSARSLCTHLGTTAVIVKRDEDGCELAYPGSPDPVSISSQARAVHDVTGAGDQFLATLGCARAAGLDWLESARLANCAAGLQVERHGCVPVTIDDLIASFPEK